MNYLIITDILPDAEYKLSENNSIIVVKNPYGSSNLTENEYEPLTGQFWRYAAVLTNKNEYSADIRDLIVFHSFLSSNTMTYRYADSSKELTFEDDVLDFIRDTSDIDDQNLQIVDYDHFPILIESAFNANPDKFNINFKSGLNFFSNLKEKGGDFKKIYDLIQLYVFARCFDEQNHIYSNSNLSLSFYVTILESIRGKPEVCNNELECKVCGSKIPQHFKVSLEKHFKNAYGRYFKKIRDVRHATYHKGDYFDFFRYWSDLRKERIKWTDDVKYKIYMDEKESVEEITRIILSNIFIECYDKFGV